jgi:hypothetical protein
MSQAPPTSPPDQAAGLRRLFATRLRHMVPLIANPHVAFASVVLERMTTALAALGASTLLVDAADSSPPTPSLACVDLAACVEQLASHTAYLPARGLPRAHVDTRGSAAGLLTALGALAPQADTVVLHGEALELARVFMHCELRPVLITSEHIDAVKHAYAAVKLLSQRCGLKTFDLLMVAPRGSRRARAVVPSLAGCAENFMGSMLHSVAYLDPAVDVAEAPGADLCALLSQQRQLGHAPTVQANTAELTRAASARQPPVSWHATLS